MDPAGTAANVIKHWDRMTAVDALIDAVEQGDSAHIRTLAASSHIRSVLDEDTWTRLEVLACLGVSGCTELEQNAIETVSAEPHLPSAPFGGGLTLLHRAARQWATGFASALLEIGADPNIRDHAGHTPLYHAGNRFPRPPRASNQDASTLVALFARYGADFDLADGVKRCTPLHMAARRGHADLAEALIAHGANIEARDSNGETPLRRAVNCGHTPVARVLVAAGADPMSRCKRGRTPIEAARSAELRTALMNPLH